VEQPESAQEKTKEAGNNVKFFNPEAGCEPILPLLQPFLDISQIEIPDEYARSAVQSQSHYNIGNASTFRISQEFSPMMLVDRTVRARLSVLTPRDSGAFIAAQPNMEGSSRRSSRHLGADAGRLAGGRFAAQLMRMAAAAGIAGLFGAPLLLAQNLGTVALGSSSSATAVTVTVAIGGTLDNISVSTQGVSNLDFSNTGGGTCAVSTAYSSAQSCTVEVTFSPTAPGLRLGAVTLHDSSGELLGTGYVCGTGTGSLLRFNPGTQAVLYSSLNAPQAMVVDAGSNIYIADTLHTRVLKLPWNGTSYGTPVTVGSGWSAPSGVAVDGAGNVYVADASLNKVVEVPWAGSAYSTQFDIAGTYPFAQDLTIDGSGNL
jgi:hypothetical protein